VSRPASTLPPQPKLPFASLAEWRVDADRPAFHLPSFVTDQFRALAAPREYLTVAQTLRPVPVLTEFPTVPFITKKSKVAILPVPMVEMDFKGRVGGRSDHDRWH
jgi:hypothetical protein